MIETGTNIYMRRKEPRMVPEYDETHVCKLSSGWKVHFDGSSACDNAWEPRDEQAPSIGSMDDLRGYLNTGEWELVDEYGKVYTDWEAEIESLVAWDGGKSSWNELHPDKPTDVGGA